VTVAVAGDSDPTVLAALDTAKKRRWVGEYHFRNAAGAVQLVRDGLAKLLMKGLISTPDLLQAVLDPDKGLRTGHIIGQIVLMEIVPAQRRFLLVDTGICIHPTLEQKADLVASAVRIAHQLGCARPRVAVMAATEKVTIAMPETRDAVQLVAQAQCGAFGNCAVQGPLSFDLAYAADAGDKKHIPGEVVGAADVMLFPSLVTANLTVKAIMYTAPCRFGGVLVGTACPVVFMSRADTVATRLNSMALALQLLAS
jgi:phosphotransacetylase